MRTPWASRDGRGAPARRPDPSSDRSSLVPRAVTNGGAPRMASRGTLVVTRARSRGSLYRRPTCGRAAMPGPRPRRAKPTPRSRHPGAREESMKQLRALTGGRTPASETPRRVILWRLALACWTIGIVILQAQRASAGRLLPDGFTYYAAALRLNVGHLLYRISPGDLPIH